MLKGGRVCVVFLCWWHRRPWATWEPRQRDLDYNVTWIRGLGLVWGFGSDCAHHEGWVIFNILRFLLWIAQLGRLGVAQLGLVVGVSELV